MPNLEGNITPEIFYASVSSEILSIARTTAGMNNMVTTVSLLKIRIKKGKIPLGNTLKYLISLQILLKNLLSLSLYN